MKKCIAISITIHIFLFLFLYNVSTSKVYNNDIALYIDSNIESSEDVFSSDEYIPKTSVRNKPDADIEKEETEIKQDDNDRESSEVVNSSENNSDSETGQYQNAVVVGVINGIKLPVPIYPALAKKRGLKGTTIVDIFIEKTGLIYDVKVVSSSGERILDNAVKETILKRWKLPPANKSLVVRKIFEFDLVD